jgi:putative nucleotidyltransferase with HDIG domain
MSEQGKIILSENTALTDALITRLQDWGVHSLYIKEPTIEDADNVISIVSEQRIFTRKHTEIVRILKDAFEKARYFKEVPLAQMSELADQSIESLVSTSGVMSHLKAIRSTDDYTFRHSVNVGIIAGVIGKWLGFKGPALKELVLAGLLHDIGKTQVPLEVLNKPDKLSRPEQDIMQEHATVGFELIKKSKQVSQAVMLGVWQHHERLDGSGYPFRLSGQEIATAARVIAVADVYDAMTTNRIYRSALTPFSVIEEVFGEMFNKLDPEISLTFLNNLKDSLIGYIVRLSDGSQARVVYLDKTRLVQPIVKIADGRYIDLEKRRDLNIIEVVAT